METTVAKPQATEKERDVYKTELRPDVKSGELIKTKIHVGKEMVRMATCPKSPIDSKNFEGVNEAGWIFKCRGDDDHDAHRFVAVPA